MARIKIVQFSELTKGNFSSWWPPDHILESKLADLIELRNKRIAFVDARLTNICNLDKEIEDLKKEIEEQEHESIRL